MVHYRLHASALLDVRRYSRLNLKSAIMADTVPSPAKRVRSLLAIWPAMHHGKRKIATVTAAVLALGVAYHVVFGANGITVYEKKRHETRMLTQQIEQLQRENEQLKTHVDHLQSDPGAIEHQAREELHYTKPGEVIYDLPSK